MKRKILFRGKSIEPSTEGMWIEGGLLVHGNCSYILPNNPITPFGIAKYRVDPETVGQFTGMTDKNGAKIFEGDIMHFGSKYGSISDVKYIEDNAGFLIKDRWGDWHWLYNVVKSTNCEVIGNVFENKELLK